MLKIVHSTWTFSLDTVIYPTRVCKYLVHILMNEGVNDNSGRRRGVRCFSKTHYTPYSFPLCAFRPQQLSLSSSCEWYHLQLELSKVSVHFGVCFCFNKWLRCFTSYQQHIKVTLGWIIVSNVGKLTSMVHGVIKLYNCNCSILYT